jgi:golgin subfamily B member 1
MSAPLAVSVLERHRGVTVQLADQPPDDRPRWEEELAGLIAKAEGASDPATRVGYLRDAAAIYERQLADLPRALISWQAAFAAAPEDDDIAASIERVAEELGCWHTVLPECEALLEKTTEPAARAALLTRLAGWQERVVGEDTSAEQRLCEAAALVPGSVRVARARSALYGGRGEWSMAIDVLERTAAAARRAEDKVGLLLECAGLVQTHLGDSDRAAQLYRQVLDVAPDNAAAVAALAEVPPLEVSPAIMCEHYRRAHQTDPGNLTVIRQWADLAFANERWTEVRLLFDHLYARAGGVTAAVEPDSRTLLGESLERFVAGRRWFEAIGVLRTMANDVTGVERARCYLTAGKIAQNELKDDVAAAELFGVALETQPDDLATFDRLCSILSKRQAWTDAEDMVRGLIERLRAAGRGEEAAVMVPLWRRLGDVYRLGLRNLARAAEAYRECARLAPDDRFVRLVADLIERPPVARAAKS